MKRTPTNPVLRNLIKNIKDISIKHSSAFWERIASDLEKPTRHRREVNLSRINRYTEENETIIVPGKVLGSGTLDHKVNIIAWQFSQGALQKIQEQKSTFSTIEEAIKKHPDGKGIRIIG